MASRPYDVVVVGAGHNGLVAAAYLARAGVRVLVLERRAVVGGLCVTEEVFPGFRINLAANSCHNLEPRVVIDLELEKHGLQFAYPEPSSFMAFPGGSLFVGWGDKQKFASQIAHYSKKDATGYFETLQELNDLAETLDVSFFEPPPSFGDLASKLRTPHEEDVFRKVMFGSATELVSERIESPEIRATLAIAAVAGGFIGPSTPGSAYMLFHRPLYRASRAVVSGSRHHTLGTGRQAPIGGMGMITAAMERSLRSSGGDVRTGVEVVALDCREGRVRGVVLSDGEVIETTVVVSNLNPKSTLLNLVPHDQLPTELTDRVHGTPMTGSIFKVFLALDGIPHFLGASSSAENELLAKGGFRIGPSIETMDQSYHEALEGRWSTNPMIWGLIPSAIDPRMAPAGKHVMGLSVLQAPYDLKDSTWEIEKDRFGKHIIDVLAEYVPNLKDLILDVQFTSPQDLEQEFGLTGANTTHGDMTPAHMFSLRPFAGCSAYRTPIAGLYLSSVGTWPGNYVSGIPGHNAAREVLRDLALDRITISTKDTDIPSNYGPN